MRRTSVGPPGSAGWLARERAALLPTDDRATTTHPLPPREHAVSALSARCAGGRGGRRRSVRRSRRRQVRYQPALARAVGTATPTRSSRSASVERHPPRGSDTRSSRPTPAPRTGSPTPTSRSSPTTCSPSCAANWTDRCWAGHVRDRAVRAGDGARAQAYSCPRAVRLPIRTGVTRMRTVWRASRPAALASWTRGTAVQMVRSGRSVPDVADALGVSQQSLRNAGAHSPFRPGRAICLAGLWPGRRRRRHRSLDGITRRLLRQRRRRELLRDPWEGADPSPRLAAPPPADRRGLRPHRDLLQPPPTPLHPRHARSGPTRCQTLSLTTTDQARPTSPRLSEKPGQCHTRAPVRVPASLAQSGILESRAVLAARAGAGHAPRAAEEGPQRHGGHVRRSGRHALPRAAASR